MSKRFTPMLSIALLSACVAACATAGASAPGAPAREAAAPVLSRDADLAAATGSITTADVTRRVAYLADDALLGRDTPSPGLETAAAYLAGEMRRLGLAPAPGDTSFIRRWNYERNELDEPALAFTMTGMATTPAWGTDYFLLPSSNDTVAGTPIYAGTARTGVAAPAGAAGSILVFYLPGAMGAAWQQSLSAALQASFSAGAAAAVLVLDAALDDETFTQLVEEGASQMLPLTVVGLRNETGRAFLTAGGVDADAAIDGSAPAGRAMDGRLTVVGPVRQSAHMAPNVVGVLPGSDPALRDEYVVYSAHFDHVGVGSPDAAGDSIFNGADDNASGTSAVLEVAEAFAALRHAPARSVMFLFVSGEEKGLLGSAAFMENPPVPAADMAANINMDMVGRNAPDTVVAIGQDYSSLGPTIQSVNARHPDFGLTVAPDQWPEEQLFFRSDHFSFAAKEVPAIFFTTGLHDEYHQPSDEAATIDAGKIARVSRLLFRFGHELATSAERPRWTPEGLAEVRRQTTGR